ncbi:hypothetical protein [Dactylosporangium sp. CS-033363]|uniref:hypothetical protein n=1 Tax=Dactylosporangium sp. CS-033363 TaxID=3239935 RepID=UPI003D8CAB3E
MDEDRIRAAYEALAATAPPPERVRARIAGRARVHRQRRALLVGAGAMGGVAAATAVGLPLLGRGDAGGGVAVAPSGSGAPSGSAAPSGLPAPSGSGVPAGGIPLRFAPGWLPDGLTERYREVSWGFAGVRRAWLPGSVFEPEDHSLPPGVSMAIGETFDDNGEGEPVMIGEWPGTLRTGDLTLVSWKPAGIPVSVLVAGLPQAKDLALRVARSVGVAQEVQPVTMHLPVVPKRFEGLLTWRVHPRANGWLTSLSSMSVDRTRQCMVVATTGAAPAHTYARAQRPGGVTVWVPDEQEPSANFTRDEADQALRDLEFSAPDLSWAKQR